MSRALAQQRLCLGRHAARELPVHLVDVGLLIFRLDDLGGLALGVHDLGGPYAPEFLDCALDHGERVVSVVVEKESVGKKKKLGKAWRWEILRCGLLTEGFTEVRKVGAGPSINVCPIQLHQLP